MFCRCENVWGEAKNTRTCPVCLAHPGALPVPNAQAIESTVNSASPSGARSRHVPFSTASITGIPTCPRGTRSPSTTCPSARVGISPFPGRTAIARSGSSARTSRRTRPRASIAGVPAGASRARPSRWSTTTGRDAARRDRLRAGHPLARGGAPVPPAPPADGRRAGISDAEMEKGSFRCDANVSVREEVRRASGRRPSSRTSTRSSSSPTGSRPRWHGRSGSTSPARKSSRRRSTSTRQAARSPAPLQGGGALRYFPEPDLVAVEPPQEYDRAPTGRASRGPGRAHPQARGRGRLRSGRGTGHRGRDELYTRVPGDRRGVANVLMNQLVGAGVDPAAVKGRGAREADRGERSGSPSGVHGGYVRERRPRLQG